MARAKQVIVKKTGKVINVKPKEGREVPPRRKTARNLA